MAKEETIFEMSQKGKIGYSLPVQDVKNASHSIDDKYLRNTKLSLPKVSEVDVIRHYTRLSQKNYGVDQGIYPLGSCTMKYNPKINEDIAQFAGLAHIHPLQDESTVQGAMEIIYDMQEMLKELTGMDEVTLQPAAGSQGELTGLMMIKAYLIDQGLEEKDEIIIPDSAHGTNPASTTMTGFKAIEIKSNKDGTIDLKELKEKINDKTAGLMLTNPNTLGIFEKDISKISQMIHDVGGLVYYDGANMNANMGIARPKEMGFDIVHINTHKTLSTPHGGGGPGAGPVGVVENLKEYLPIPQVRKQKNDYHFDYDIPKTIGKVKSYYGNFLVLVRAYVYMLTMGASGLKEASQMAVLNANYMKESLKEEYNLAYEGVCKHEFVLSGLKNPPDEIHTLDVAKRLIDYGYHPPTIYFPLIVEEALMIEPNDTEGKAEIDGLIDAFIAIAKEAKENPSLLKNAPSKTPVKRLDEVTAARTPILKE